MTTRPHHVPTRAGRLHRGALLALTLLLAGCSTLFGPEDFIALEPLPEQLYEIDAMSLRDESRSEPMTVEEAGTREALKRIVEAPAEEGMPLELPLEQVRAAALEGNLDLQVELVDPSIAQTSVDAEQAKFESTFFGSMSRSVVDSPTAVATEGSQVTFDRYEAGLEIPFRTGGTATITLPASKTKTDNPFAVLDPSYTADLRFSLSQPLLRNAGPYVNTYSIRVARYQQQVTTAQTKLETMRILANVDRAYWRLYAFQREVEVRQQQFELAVAQLERARRRVNAGDVAEVEVIRAESGVAQSLEGIIVSRTSVRRAERDLKRLMNRDDLPMNSEIRLVLSTSPNPVSLDLDPEALAAFAVATRMEMLELEILLALDATTIDFRRNATLPLITLDYTYSPSGLGDSYRDAFGDLPDHSFEDWSLGLTARIPIGNEVAEAGLQRAILDRIRRLASKEQRRVAIVQEVYDSLDRLHQNWQRILAARTEVILASRTYDAEKRQFDVGARTSTDVLNASTELADAQSREISAVTDYQVSQIDLAFATGTLLGYERVIWEPRGLDEDE